MTKKMMVCVWLLMLAFPLMSVAATVEERAARIIDKGGENVVEMLVDTGKGSVEDAAAVIFVTADTSPALLQDVIEGLAAVMDPADLARAIALAQERAGDDDDLRLLIAEAAQGVFEPASGRRGRGRGEDRGRGEGRVGEEPVTPDPEASPS